MRAKRYVRIAAACNSTSRIEKDTYLRFRRAVTAISGKYANVSNSTLRNSGNDSAAVG